MGEFADFTNCGGYNGEGLYEREYKQPKMPKKGTYPTEWKPPVDYRDDWSEEEIMADMRENGFR